MEWGLESFIFNKMGEVTTCLCVCGGDPVEGQSVHVREELDRCS